MSAPQSGGRRYLKRTVFVVGLGVVATAGLRAGRRRLQERIELQDQTGAPIPPISPPSKRTRLGSGGNARLLPPSWEPASLTALADWVPAPPRRPLARTAAYVWAAPLTAAGLLVGVLSGVRPRVEDGVLLFPRAGGIPGRVIRWRRFSAGTLGHVVIAVDEPSPALFAHELVHVRQAERLGPLMAPLYLALLAVYGYARHPLERAARRGARQAITRD